MKLSHGHERIDRVAATLLDGRTLAKGVKTRAVIFTDYVQVEIPHLRYVEEVVNIQWHTDPPCNYVDIGNKDIEGNIVGVTVAGPVTGTTLTLEILALGI